MKWAAHPGGAGRDDTFSHVEGGDGELSGLRRSTRLRFAAGFRECLAEGKARSRCVDATVSRTQRNGCVLGGVMQRMEWAGGRPWHANRLEGLAWRRKYHCGRTTAKCCRPMIHAYRAVGVADGGGGGGEGERPGLEASLGHLLPLLAEPVLVPSAMVDRQPPASLGRAARLPLDWRRLERGQGGPVEERRAVRVVGVAAVVAEQAARVLDLGRAWAGAAHFSKFAGPPSVLPGCFDRDAEGGFRKRHCGLWLATHQGPARVGTCPSLGEAGWC